MRSWIVFGVLVLLLCACSSVQDEPLTPVNGSPSPVAPSPTITLTPSSNSTEVVKPTPSFTAGSPTPHLGDKPTQTPTPTVEWFAETIEINWPANYPGIIERFEWQSESRILITTYYLDSSGAERKGEFSIDLASEEPSQARRLPTLDFDSISPQETFGIRCREEIELYRLPEDEMLSSAAIPLPYPASFLSCEPFIDWAADESAFSLVARGGHEGVDEVFVWRTDGSPPLSLGDIQRQSNIVWSPDSKRLALVRDRDYTSNSATLEVRSIDGNILSQYKVEPYRAFLEWLTNNVIKFIYQGKVVFFDMDSESELFIWHSDSSADGVSHQNPRLSPDQRWLEFDQGGWDYDFVPPRLQKRYSLNNLDTWEEVLLSDSPQNFLAFCGWESDSSAVYFINRPWKETSTSQNDMPFGLLAFDPLTNESTLLFERAFHVRWNADKSKGFVTYPKVSARGEERLFAVIWDVETGEMSDEYFVSDQVVYGDPLRERNSVLRAVWSSGNDRVVYASSEGEINLLDLDGDLHTLTKSWQKGRVPRSLVWSLDDRHILVDFRWIVAVPQP
jgi:hypothetical protein